jgi:diguanylate cyclase (GGDEF)-like protein
MKISIRNKLFLSHLLIVVFITATIGVYFYIHAAENLLNCLKERLKSSAALVSPMIDAEELLHIRSAEDTARPEYQRNLSKLRTLCRTNPDIAFLYVMRREGEQVYFVLDSDETEQQALPGTEYRHRFPRLMQGFTSVMVDDRIVSDEWGSFLSGYAPIKHGNGQFLVGIDMRANEVTAKYQNLRISGAVSVLAAIGLAFFLARFLSHRFMVPINLTIARCASVAVGRLDDERIAAQTHDEFDRLIEAFNDMLESLSASEQKTRAALASLNQAKEELEIRVRQRTQDLKEAHDQLSREVAERLVAQEALQEAAVLDPLTRLYNRRALQEKLENEAARSRRNLRPFVLILVDLDRFKSLNDSFGHDAGDNILMETALRMKSMIRRQDMIARWGGDEFVILLVETELKGGGIVAEKIRSRIADEPYYFAGQDIHLTASFGIAPYGGEPDLDRVIHAADSALYKAKRNGRNRVEAGGEAS